MRRTTALMLGWLAGLAAAAALHLAGQTETALVLVTVVWGLGLLVVVWLALVGPAEPVRMPPRRLPVVPPLNQPDPQTRDLERLLTRRFGDQGRIAELAAVLTPLVDAVPPGRRSTLPPGLAQFCADPQRRPSAGTLRGWLDALQEASDAR